MFWTSKHHRMGLYLQIKPVIFTKQHHKNIISNSKIIQQSLTRNRRTVQKKQLIWRQKNQLSDKIECLARSRSSITLKDYSDSYQSRLHCRLLNPSRSELGKISKSILENVIIEDKKAVKAVKAVPIKFDISHQSFSHPSQKSFSIRLYYLRNNITTYPMIIPDQ